MDSAQKTAEEILRRAGLSSGEARAAWNGIQPRLDAIGATSAVPILPGREANLFTHPRPTIESRVARVVRTNQNPAGEGGAVSELLMGNRSEPVTVLLSDTSVDNPSLEPTDLLAATAVTSLATTAAGGTEVKFSHPGIVYVGAGPVGLYWARALGAAQNIRWSPIMSGVRLAYHPESALFLGTNNVGGIAPGGAMTLAFYKMPDEYAQKKGAWRDWHKSISEWTEGASDTTGTAGVLGFIIGGGPTAGTDVTLGTFTDSGAGTQIFKAGTNMPAGGAVAKGSVIANAPSTNTDVVWVGETALLAVASNGAIGQMGQDTWNINIAGKLFMLANSGTQKLGARYRS